MFQIPLSALPSPDLTVTLDGAYWRLSFFLSINFVCVDIERNGQKIVTGDRCYMGQPLMPHKYMHAPEFGNFIFDNEVDWENFGGTCNLYYLNAEEFAEYNSLVQKGLESVAIKNMAARYALTEQQYQAQLDKSVNASNIPRVTITKEPENQTVIETLSASFSVAATNATTYQWEFSTQEDGAPWKPIAGANGTSYTVPIVNRVTMGYYRCVVHGESGVDVSRSAMLALSSIRPPVFTGHPQSITILEGSVVQLAAEAQNVVSYQWQYSKAGGPFNNIPGAVNSTYTILGVTDATAGRYRVIANGYGGTQVASLAATVEYGTAPKFNTQPQNVKLKGGEALNMTVSVTNANRYVWEFSPSGTSNWKVVADKPTSTLTIARPTTADNGYYRVTAYNQYGHTASNNATLEVVELPRFTKAPVNASVPEDGSVTMTAEAVGQDSVKWEKSINGGTSWTTVSGATTLSLTISSAKSSDVGLYRVVITNFAGSINSQCSLAVVLKPVISKQPVNAKIAEGQKLEFSVEVTNSWNYSFWQKSADGTTGWTKITGSENKKTYTVASAVVGDSGFFRFVVQGEFATAYSSVAKAEVIALPAFTSVMADRKINENESATLSFTQTGADTITWEISKDGGATWTPVVGAAGTSYTVASAKAKDKGTYRVTIANFAGSVTDTAVLDVVLYPVVSIQPTAQKLKLGEDLVLTCEAAPTDTYIWQWKASNVWSDVSVSPGKAMTITAPAVSLSGQYRCKISNEGLVTYTNEVSVEIIALPKFTLALSDTEFQEGSAGTLTIAQTGADTIQWQKSPTRGNWVNISGANSETYTIPKVVGADALYYRCLLTNFAGQASTSCQVTVELIPVITLQPVAQKLKLGENLNLTSAANNALTQQWFYSTNNINYYPIDGATSTSYSLTAPPIDKAGYYRIRFTNKTLFKLSDAVLVEIIDKPNITTPLSPVNAEQGDTVVMSVVATGQDTVKWEKSTNGGSSWTTLAGKTSLSLSLPSVGAADMGIYRITLTNFAGSVTSQAALNVALQPVITRQPAAQDVAEDSILVLSIDATYAVSYQWQTSAEETSWSDIAGATGSQYIKNSPKVSDTAFYRCIVTNGRFTATSNSVKITVHAIPVFTTPPNGGSAAEGGTFTIQFYSTGETSIKWEYSAVFGAGAKWNVLPDTGRSKVFNPVTMADNGYYRITLSNAWGSRNSMVSFVVYQKPVFSAQPQNLTVNKGSTIRLTAEASPVQNYLWQYSTDGSSWSNISGQTGTILSISNAQMSNAGKYRCVAVNQLASTASDTVTVTVNNI